MPKTKPKPAGSSASAPSPRQDVLSRKRRRSATYVLELDDPAEAQAALSDVARRLNLAVALHGEDSEQVAELAPQLEQAQAAVDACSHTITLRALAGNRFRELVKAHPPTDEQKAERAEWNPDTFHAALIAACAEGEGLSEQQWAAALDSDDWSVGERNALFNLALQVNVSTPDTAMHALDSLRQNDRYLRTGRF
jgi:small-conductance mechanosensitive channel